MDSNGILDIKNRTENWQTAKRFAPLIVCPRKQYEFAKYIISNQLGSCPCFSEDDVIFELFWKGFRDSIKRTTGVPGKSTEARKAAKISEAAEVYRKHFPDLRARIEKYNSAADRGEKQPKLRLYKPCNYLCDESKESESSLYNNLMNTEIDVVVSAPGFLLIGEVKGEETFNAASKHILTHQLIRQYVMADILLQMTEPPTKAEIIPFVIGDQVERTAQVKCMLNFKWLSKKNIISWSKVDQLVRQWA